MTFTPTEFDESKVVRDADGKFGEKVGSAPELDGLLFVPGDTSKVADLETRVSKGVISFERPDGAKIEFDTGRGDSVYDAAVVAEQLADGTTEVRWAARYDEHDEFPFTEGDEIQEFRSEEARDEFIAQQIENGVPENHIFIVEKFSHGMSRYSVFDGELSDRWDAAPSNVLVIDGKNEHGIADEDMRGAADATLKEYTDWANGETYCVNQTFIGPDGEEVDPVDRYVVHGFIGAEYAKQTIESGDF